MKWFIEPSDLVDAAFIDHLESIRDEMGGHGLFEQDAAVMRDQLQERGWQFECLLSSVIDRLKAKRGVSS